MTTRLIVKNLPPNCTEVQLRKFFEKYGEISDASLKYKDGKFRGFAFVGFSDEQSAEKAMRSTNQTFFNSKKLTVEECRPFGDSNKPRAWSKYSKDSSAYKRAHGGETEEKTEKSGNFGNSGEPTAKKVKNDEKLEQFLEAKGVKVEKEVKLNKDKSEEEKKLMNELMERIEGDTSNSLIFTGLPSSAKGKNIKEWLNPIRVKAMKIARNDDFSAAFVTFNRPPDVRRALQKDGQFLGGFKIGIEKIAEPEKPEIEEEHGAELTRTGREEEEIREKILETGRLYVRNLPYSTKESHLQYTFKPFGEISEILVIIDKKTGLCKGYAHVEFVFPESAVAAFSALDGTDFRGRILHILPGQEKRTAPSEDVNSEDVVADDPDNPLKQKKEKKKKTFKEEKAENQKASAEKTAYSWNALFLGANAVADTLAARLNIKKSDLLTSDSGESAAVRLALAETRLVKETADFFRENGIKLDAFNRPAVKRSDSVMIAKNLPAGVEAEELQRMFEKFGDCQKVLMPESGISAIVLMGNPVDAKKAFRALAYSRIRSQPLYLEWAPYDAVEENSGTSEDVKNSEDVEEKPKKNKREMTYEEKRKERKKRRGEDVEEEEEEDSEDVTSSEDKKLENPEEEQKNERKTETDSRLFVKNVSFNVNDEELDEFFRKRYGDRVKCANIAKKFDPKTQERLAMGFGFVEFYTSLDAKTALKEMQGEMLDGRSLELKISHRETLDKGALKRKGVNGEDQNERTKLMMRNLPFGVKMEEIQSLFSAYGTIKAIRLPKKSTKEKRGFGFVEFISPDDAKKAFELIGSSTHLYGRVIKLEWAKDEESVAELRQKTAERFGGGKTVEKKNKKSKMEEMQTQLQIADDEKE